LLRLITLAAAVAALLVPAAPAFAGDPIMPLWQVHAGMRCTGYSVIQGTAISSFDVEVLDVTGGEAAVDGGRILIRVSGPAVDATGVGPGFSGSPIYCDAGDGVSRNIGAISESVNEYGGKVALATPIETILGTPVDVPGRPSAGATPAPGEPAGTGASARPSARRRAAPAGGRPIAARPSARMRAALASAKPIAAPLSVSGLSGPLARALTAAGAKAGRPVLAVPPGPLGTFPPQVLRPGSAVAVGYSSGDIRTSSVGTVAYVDGDRVWAFGHQLEGAGRRALLLQDAYVFRIVNNPLQLGQVGTTYKLAASGHDLGTVSSDGFSAVAGRTGPLPHTVPVTVITRDLDSHAIRTVTAAAADEAAVDLPSGGSWTSFVAPLAVAQGAGAVLGSTPARLTGEMCARIGIAEIKQPLRFCNRYVSVSSSEGEDGATANAVLTGAANDLGGALATIDAYTGSPPRVTGVNVLLKMNRGAAQAFIRDVSLPERVRPGQRVRARLRLQRVRGPRFNRTYTLRIPSDAPRGRQRLRLVGQDADQGEDGFATIILGEEDERDEGGNPGPATLSELAEEVKDTARYDGVSVRIGRARARAFRDEDFRISGLGEATVSVVR
jgi:hypothetical protein